MALAGVSAVSFTYPDGTEPALDAVSLELEPGDVVVAFTDGLVERRSEMLEVGFDRLCEVLAEVGDGEDVGLALVARLAADSQDDVCVMTLRVPRV